MQPAKKFHFSLASILIAIALVAPTMAKQENAANPLDPQTIAVEAYVYLYPMILMDLTRLQMTNVEKWDGKTSSAPVNTLAHFRTFPPLDFRTVVRPNFDTLYTILWMDMTEEPMVLSIPDSQGRYYLMPALDMWTDAFSVPGWRTTGTKAGSYAYCPPGWKGELPAGITRINSPTPVIWFIGRTQANGEKDFAAVNKFQDGMKLTPLSGWGKNWTAPVGQVDPSVDMKTPPSIQIENMNGKQFFEYASRLMKLHPPKATDFSQVARLKHIGIVPGEELDYDKLDKASAVALDKAPAAGIALMKEKVKNLGSMSNGWQMLISTLGVYGVDYLQRGGVALFGLGANQLPDAIYPQLMADAEGQPLTGENEYVLHFNKEGLPPADAFWSLTIYDAEGFPIPNALDRASRSGWMDLNYGNDGSLDLYFQPTSPGKGKEANWLPTPKQGEWNLTLRIYAPRPEVANGTWNPPAIQKK